MSIEEWQTICMTQTMCAVLNIVFLAKCFPPDRLRRLLVLFLSIFMSFAILCGIVGVQNAVFDFKNYNFRELFQLVSGTFIFLLVVYL